MPGLAEDIAAWLQVRTLAAGAGGLVVGLSGGLDSAVAARLCQMAFPLTTVAVLLPCHSDPQDERDARLVIDHFRLKHTTIDLSQPYDAFVAAVQRGANAVAAAAAGEELRMPLANIKPRLRMSALYFLAHRLKSLVAGTGNRSELAVGYFTKWGDGGVDLLPLGDLLKSEVRALARELNVPSGILEKPPSAGLWLGQTDEAELGCTYDELERFLAEGAGAVAPALALRIERLMRASEHKRQPPLIFEQTREARR